MALSGLVAVSLITGCSGTQNSNSSSGGAASIGGSSGNAGASTGETGGIPANVGEEGGTAGAPSTDLPATGGSATGGMTTNGNPTGGARATGGSRSTGGTTTSSSTATGGTSNTGGSNAITGGRRASGGVASTGGALGTAGNSPTGGTPGAGGATDTAGPTSATDLCARWSTDTADMSETGFTGNVSTCTMGDMSATSRANALRVLNLYRWIAALPAVTTSDQHNQDDQACALMMAANNTLNHTPPSTWTCYTANGATAAGSSNIAGSGATLAMAMYMVDPGNETTLGHRRWCLSNTLGPIGIGSTGSNSYSCMWTLNGTGKAGKQWMAWPPPGFFPIQAARDNWNRTLDTTGWSMQSDSINLAGAVVTVTLNGSTLPVKVTQLAANYGSRYAITFIPSGWTMAAGNVYHVSITGISTAIEYDVQVVSC